MTIAAIATPNGVGAISIVRVSGKKALEVAKRLTNKEFLPRVATLSKIYDLNGKLIDIAIVIYFKAPNSFTGEDIVEFQCHGGIVVSKMILEEIIKIDGVRLAMPGEFSKRAFLNGKIDASEAEAIAKLIETKSREGARLLAKQLDGDLKRFVEDIRSRLIEIMAYSEVFIDYAEEDLPETLGSEIESKLNELNNILNHTLEVSKRREAMLSGYKVAIVGKPNVGKSSILNALLNKERAIVSDIAGTTRDTIEEDIQIGTHLIKIVDTAGIREAKDEIERIGVDRSKKAIEEADIVIAVFAEKLEKEDKEIIELIKNCNKDVLIVVNKIDIKDLSLDLNYKIVKISAKKDITPLVDALRELLDSYSGEDEHILISTRQINAVEKALKYINDSREFLKTGELELFSYHIQDAIKAISEITKPFEYDEMLDMMFNNFCVGK